MEKRYVEIIKNNDDDYDNNIIDEYSKNKTEFLICNSDFVLVDDN